MEPNNENTAGSEQIPEQHTGTEMNAVEKVELSSEAEAILFFKIVAERLLDVNRWAILAGNALSHFFLTDLNGNPVDRKVVKGDLIKIDIPGPGTKTGGGYDWVEIEEVNVQVLDGGEILSIRARPVSNPLANTTDIAHFLSDEATSTFQVKRIGNTIYAEEHGRNEVPN